MKMIGWVAVALLALVSMSAAKTKVELKDAQGKDVGSVVIWDQGAGVALEVNVHDLTPGSTESTSIKRPSAKGRTSNPRADTSIPKAKSTGSIAQTATTLVT